MCTSPCVISIRNEALYRAKNASSSLADYFRWSKKYGKEVASYSRLKRYGLMPTLVNQITVPCGKCVECLKKRQNDLAVRCMREAEKRGSMVFATLTYNESSLPLACSLRTVDMETGELISQTPPSLLVRYKGETKALCAESSEFVESCRKSILSQSAGRLSRRIVIPFPVQLNDGCYREYEITPSLNRRDARLWLKRCRVRYEREFGCKLPEFSYVMVGEYGPKTCRPHYHFGFFGLSKRQVSWMVSQWSYGEITDVRAVDAVNKDGSSGFRLASKYIGKYMVKGRFDCDCVIDKVAERPRLGLSKGLGKELSPALVSYFRAYDKFGEYDIDTGRLSDGSYLCEKQLSELHKEVVSRAHFTFDGYNYAIPNVITKSLWYVPSKKTPGSFRSSTVRTYFSSIVQFDSFENYLRARRKGQDDSLSKDDILSAQEFCFLQETNNLVSEAFNASRLRSEYNNSIF